MRLLGSLARSLHVVTLVPQRMAAVLAAFATALLPVAAMSEGVSTTTAEPVTTTTDRDARGARTTIDLEEGVAATGDLGVAIATSAGTDVRRAGGPGAPQWVSVRGAAPWHTRIALDGVPLGGGGAPLLDLSLLPARVLNRVTIHRGVAPMGLGPPVPGGIVHVETRFLEEGTLRFRGGGGSFGARHAGAAQQLAPGEHDILLALHYEGAEGGFPFYDDRATVFDPSDDRPDARRRNAHTDQLSALLRHRVRLGGWRWTHIALGGWRRAGLPGLASNPTRASTQHRSFVFGAVRGERPRWLGRWLDVEVAGSSVVVLDRLEDPLGEIGLARSERRDRIHESRIAVLPRLWLHDRLRAELLLDGAMETYGVAERLDPPPVDGASRLRGGLGGEATADVVAGWLEARAGGRIDAYRGSVDGNPLVLAPTPSRADTIVSPWGGLALTLPAVHGLEVQVTATAQMGGRMPSFVELYGDRGDTVGNPALRSERQRGAEAGVSLAWRAEQAARSATVDWTFFDRTIEDLILPVETGLGVTVPRNVALAALRGHEVAAAARFDWLHIHAAWTLLDALDRSPDGAYTNQRLPVRPEHSVHAGAGVRLPRGGVAWTTDVTSEFFLDRSGRRPIPARFENHLRADWVPWFEPTLRLALEGRNLGDRRVAFVEVPDGGALRRVPRAVADLQGQPLPGRAVYVTLSWEFGGNP